MERVYTPCAAKGHKINKGGLNSERFRSMCFSPFYRAITDYEEAAEGGLYRKTSRLVYNGCKLSPVASSGGIMIINDVLDIIRRRN